MRRTYVLALAAIAFLTFVAHWTVQNSLARSAADGATINLSGRQRMLSQRVVQVALASRSLGETDPRQDLVSRGLSDLTLISDSHRYLVGLPTNGPKVSRLFERIEPVLQDLLERSRTALDPASPWASQDTTNLLDVSSRFLGQMHGIVNHYQDESDARIQKLQDTERLLLFATLFVLTLELLFVFEPMRRSIRRLFQSLEDERAQAIAGVQAKEQFLATMSHEIRTPLNGIVGMNELMLTTQLDNRQRQYANAVERSAVTLSLLIDDILDYSKISSGHLDLERVPFDLVHILEDVCLTASTSLDSENVEIIVNIDSAVPQGIHGDPTRLRQVVTNLVGNAVKFTQKGHIELRAICKGTDASEALEISIRDTGVGIPPGRQKRIFERFTQADSSTTRRFGGTGLGLAICRDLVELMGGTISLESEPNRGSTFTVKIPIVAADLSSGHRSPNLRERRILVVDDHPLNREIIKGHLDGLGATVQCANDGVLALEAVENSPAPFDLVITDQHMPNMDGLEFVACTRRRDDYRDVPFIMLSSALGRIAGQVRESFAAIIHKPVWKQLLEQSIAAVFDGSPAESRQTVEGAPAPSLNLRVLVAEDVPTNQKLLTAHLGAFQCECELAQDGAQAIELAHRFDFDLILMDCQMPVLDGLEATRQLREDSSWRQIPIIALTANAMPGDREKCIEAGMDDYLSKPFRRRDLEAVLLRNRPADEPLRSST